MDIVELDESGDLETRMGSDQSFVIQHYLKKKHYNQVVRTLAASGI